MNRPSRDHSGKPEVRRPTHDAMAITCLSIVKTNSIATSRAGSQKRTPSVSRTSIVGRLCQPRMLSGFTETPYKSPARQRFLFDTVIPPRYAFGWHERRASSSSGKQFARKAMAFLGTVSRRARLGNGAGGLQREWRCLELFCARSRTFARLSRERGRHRGNLRLQRPALFRFRVLE